MAFAGPWMALLGVLIMAFDIHFTILVQTWYNGHSPAVDPPDSGLLDGQLYFHSRNDVDITFGTSGQWVPAIWLRLPANEITAVEYELGQIWEVAAGSGRFYKATWKDVCHYGFSNAYFVLLLQQCDDTGALIRRFVS